MIDHSPDRVHDYRTLFESAPGSYLVVSIADLRIVAVTSAYLQATLTRRDEIIGRGIFDVFPDSSDAPEPRSGTAFIRLNKLGGEDEASGISLLADVTRRHIVETFRANRDNVTHTAHALGMSRVALRRHLHKYGAKSPLK